MKLSENQKYVGMVLLGTFIFCFALNVFITPLGLYTGGMVGLAQMIRTLLAQAGIQFSFEISGYINMMFNIPLLILAYKSISRRFFVLTLLSIISQSIFFTIIPIPTTWIVNDVLTSVVVGGILSGFGIGIILRYRGSGGGMDILGVYLTKKMTNFSVGKLALLTNCVLFLGCMVLFDIETAIYSILNTVIFSFVVDKVHYQNISITAMIFTKRLEVREFIIRDLHRGVTYWKGCGAYTDSETYVLVTAVSKYELPIIRAEIKNQDPNAFIIFSESLSVTGNFEKHL